MATSRRTIFALVSLATLVLAGSTALSACEGPEGPAGPPGAGVEAGSGPSGPQGPSGMAGGEGGLNAGCMTPCHGFKGIVEQWKTSTHYIGGVTNTEEVPSWTGPGACGNCHAGDGLEQRLAGNVGFAGGAAPPGLTSGQLNYKKTSGAVSEVTYAGASRVAVIGCTTCHDIDGTNDPHLTGANYVAGSFKLRVKSGPNDESLIEKSAVAGAVTGTPAGKWGVSNSCINCHKSRKDVTNYITATTNITSAHWGPHEGPQSDIFSGKGGYHYAGRTYASSTHQTLSGCSSCHMVKASTNGEFPDHSMRPTVATCAAAGCHAGVKTFDVAGGQGVVKAALGELEGLLAGINLLTRSESAPYQPLTPAELADQDFAHDKAMPGNIVPDVQAGALYNYMLIARGSASGVHNPIYVKQMLFDSISELKGAAPATIPTRP